MEVVEVILIGDSEVSQPAMLMLMSPMPRHTQVEQDKAGKPGMKEVKVKYSIAVYSTFKFTTYPSDSSIRDY